MDQIVPFLKMACLCQNMTETAVNRYKSNKYKFNVLFFLHELFTQAQNNDKGLWRVYQVAQYHVHYLSCSPPHCEPQQRLNSRGIIHYLDNFKFSSFPDYDTEHTAVVTSQQRLLTSPCHLILPLIFVDVLFCSYFVFFLWTFELLIKIATFHCNKVTVVGRITSICC